MRLAGSPARCRRASRTSSATLRSTVSTCSFTRRSGGRTVESLTSSGSVPSPSSLAMLPRGMAIQASATPSSMTARASSASKIRMAIVSGQSAGRPALRLASEPMRIPKASASSPENASTSCSASCRRSRSRIAVRMPSVLERASSGYIAIGITRVMNSARRSRTNSTRSRRAIASRAGQPPVGADGIMARPPGQSWRRTPPPGRQAVRRRAFPASPRRRFCPRR